MSPDEVVLLIVKGAVKDRKKNSLRGKTLLQKRGYFLDKILNLDLDYRAHYYGPYSPKLENGLSKTKALGFVKEDALEFSGIDPTGIEGRRYDYRLTDAGEKVVEFVMRKSPDETKKILDALDRLKDAGDSGDYVSLSIAAKVHHILSKASKSMELGEIREEASKLGWNISADQIDNAASLLEKLKLLKLVKKDN